MAKKDFVAIAAAFRSVLDETVGLAGRGILVEAIKRVAAVCAKSNGDFDQERFFRACGI